MRWSFGDEDQQHEASSADSGLDIGYVDIPTPAAPTALHFTFLQSDATILDYTVYEVELTA